MAKSTVGNYTILLVMVEAETNDQNVFQLWEVLYFKNWKGGCPGREILQKKKWLGSGRGVKKGQQQNSTLENSVSKLQGKEGT